jgi:hypothetical protein
VPVNIQIQHRRGTAAEWTAANPTLATGEIGLEVDTGQFKVGDATTPWTGLAYGGLDGPAGPAGPSGAMGPSLLPDDPDMPFIIPGPAGEKGDQGDAGVGGHTIADAGTPETQRGTLDFQDGFIVTDNSGAGSTDVDIDTAAIDHGGLAGLGDDDHTQYATNAELTSHEGAADPHTGYRLESADHPHTSTGLNAGQLDHGLALTGLTDDDHTQYVLESAMTAVKFSVGALVLSPLTGSFFMIWRAPFACTVTNVRGHVDAGTTTQINARRNQTSDFLAADRTIPSAGVWDDAGAVQNTAIAAGEDIEIEIVNAGTAAEVNVQVDLTRNVPS